MSNWIEPHHKVAVAFCSPHRKIKLPDGTWMTDVVTVDWMRARQATAIGTNIVNIEFYADGMEVGVARDKVARQCLSHDPVPEYLAFLDDDVLPMYDWFLKLFQRAQWNPDYDVFAGVYTVKGGPHPDPLIYAGEGIGPYWDWAIGDILTTDGHGISSVHMGLTLIRTSVFQRLIDAKVVDDEAGGEEPFFKTVNEMDGVGRKRQGTEDIYFCSKLRKIGAKIMVDTSVLAGHVDKKHGIIWGLHPDSPPVKRAKWIGGKDNERKECECARKVDSRADIDADTEFWFPEGYAARIGCDKCGGSGRVGNKLCLDIGAGGTRRKWDGYTTYTTDIRADAKPDYVMDTLMLNFPDGHFSRCASSHHLEHIGRWDQEQVWKEMFRITKPGGDCEHIVPSLEWAARKIAEKEVDGNVLNVIYGAQESHGYARQYNCHFFGYTKDIAKHLAEEAGYVDVECEDWTDRPELGYNLIIRGKKPEGVD